MPPSPSLVASSPVSTSLVQISYVGGFADALEPLGLDSGYVDEDGDKSFANISDEDHQAAIDYLREKFGVEEFNICGTFGVLWCDENTAIRAGRLPILVGGLCAVWRERHGPDFPPTFIGDVGYGGEMEVDDSLLEVPDPCQAPPDEAIEGLARHVFTDCVAITWLFGCLIVELPKTDQESFLDRIQELPGRVANAPWHLQYHNGPLANHEQRKRVIAPTPQRKEDSRNPDETDYTQLDGKFYPGSMVYSIDEDRSTSEVTAGVLVRKGAERRLTCAWHAWAHIYDKHKDLFGQDTAEAKRVFRVIQGTTPGKNVGYVRERIGKTDIALIKLHDGIIFENVFFGGNVSAKCFVHSKHVKDGDVFLIDGFTTGQQEVTTDGARWPVSRPGQLVVPESEGTDEERLMLLPEPHVKYLTGRQGVSATQLPTLRSKPFVRDSVCGAVWLRTELGGKKGRRDRSKSVVEKGEVFAMCHYADLTSVYSTATGVYLMFADTFDPLIAENWTIVPTQGSAAEPNLDQPHPPGPATGESPAKGSDGILAIVEVG